MKFPMTLMTKALEMTLVRSAEEGGRLFVLAALGSEDNKDQLRGAYLTNGEVREPADCLLGEDGRQMQEKIWVCP